jgi:hypothetical protein
MKFINHNYKQFSIRFMTRYTKISLRNYLKLYKMWQNDYGFSIYSFRDKGYKFKTFLNKIKYSI